MTATDGSATAYLYQVVNNAKVVTANAAGVTTVTFPSTSARTIIASASGWIEPFDNGVAIECRFVDSDFGRCFQINGSTAVPTNSGAPITQVVQIAYPSSTSLPPPTSSSSSKHSIPVGAIVGAVIAVLVAGLGGLLACFILRRRRQSQRWEDEKNASRAFDAAVVESTNNRPPIVSGPQAELGIGRGPRKHQEVERFRAVASGSGSGGVSSVRTSDVGGSRVVSFQIASELPTSDLVQLLAQRVQLEERAAPPYALVERGDV
ncbi:hypothetical protein C8F04DRAFT_1274258 [Mycena alexandri]|uniref:Transmembrane protein n=1 Tax=Mycena alexandri TaxID=1745969 RepID=A0AAD6S5N6_9AGAR|nr:hypothetical protein C8F04DRAFT_1274258 [Mycena alexandri]